VRRNLFAKNKSAKGDKGDKPVDGEQTQQHMQVAFGCLIHNPIGGVIILEELENDYIVNPKTVAILSHFDIQNQTKVIDEDGEFYMGKKPIQLIKDSCLEYRSTYEGRRKAVMHHMNFTQKVPIPINPRDKIYVFPTHAPDQFECMWIVYNNVKRVVSNSKGGPLIIFKNGQTIEAGVSIYTLQRQMERTAHCMFCFSM
jgi:competence protein ComK